MIGVPRKPQIATIGLVNRPRLKLPKTTYYRYTLDCGDLLYVGVTSSPIKRFTEHNLGSGSFITRTHPPKKVVKLERLGYMTYFQATRYENALVLKNLIKGKNCRGGSWCTTKAPSPSIVKSRLSTLQDHLQDFPNMQIDFTFTRTEPIASTGKKLVRIKKKRSRRRYKRF